MSMHMSGYSASEGIAHLVAPRGLFAYFSIGSFITTKDWVKMTKLKVTQLSQGHNEGCPTIACLPEDHFHISQGWPTADTTVWAVSLTVLVADTAYLLKLPS